MKLRPVLITFAVLVLGGASHSATLYVDLNSTNPVPPYGGWATAATNIQDAVDAASPGDQVLVTNGVYGAGGRVAYYDPPFFMTNRVAVNKAVTVRSVNGAAFTAIEGNPVVGNTAIRCAYLTNGASLIGFTLTNGGTVVGGVGFRDGSGGGVYCESASALVADCVAISNNCYWYGAAAYSGTLSNCSFVYNGGHWAVYSSVLLNCAILTNAWGVSGCALSNCTVSGNSYGGAVSSTLVSCRIIGNSNGYGGVGYSSATNCLIVSNNAVTYGGGGAVGSTLVNCTVANNSGTGGASASCTLQNCIVYGNSTDGAAGNYSGSNASFCCIIPLPPGGIGNFTNAPQFVNPASDFHLLPNSPCINSGNNTFLTSGADLDGSQRVAGGTVDVGAYEFQSPASIISYQWLQQYGFATDGTADFTDPDGDGMSNWKEWICGTDPTNALSVLRMNGAAPGVSGVTVSWQSVSNRTYWVERSTNMGGRPAFFMVATNVASQGGVTTYLDGSGPKAAFYRVGVQR